MEGVPSASVPPAGGEDYEEIREQVSGNSCETFWLVWFQTGCVCSGIRFMVSVCMRRY